MATHAIKFTPGTLSRLTYAHILAANPRADGSAPATLLVRDKECPALQVRTYRNSEARSYVVVARIKGKDRVGFLLIGKVGEIELEDARARAQTERAAMRTGTDRVAERSAAKTDERRAHVERSAADMTLAEVLQDYVDRKRSTSPGQCQNVEQRVTTYLRGWLKKPLLSISRLMWSDRWGPEGATILADIRARRSSPGFMGYRTANEVRTDFAVLWKHFDRTHGDHVAVPACPTVAVKKIRYARKKVSKIRADNVAALLQGLSTYAGNPLHTIFTELLLHTGMRSIEGKHLQWERQCEAQHDPSQYAWIDERRACLVLPGEFSKTGVPGSDFLIPLTAATRAILRRARAHRDAFFPSSAWVFPSATSASGHLEANNNVFRRLGTHVGLRLDMHSTRHFHRDLLRACGAAPEQQDAALNQSTPGMGNVYGERLSFADHVALLSKVDARIADYQKRGTVMAASPRLAKAA